MAENSVEYRQNAEDCREQALRAIRTEDKARWLKLAQDWQTLAEVADASTTRPALKMAIRGG
ncbi:MAG: hypothetical protein ACJ8AS_06670 [Hyphomicrobiales bacterium]